MLTPNRVWSSVLRSHPMLRSPLTSLSLFTDADVGHLAKTEEPPTTSNSTPPKPQLPQYPKNAFFTFFHRERSKIEQAHPEANYREIMRIAANMWKELDEAEKQPLIDAARVLIDDYMQKKRAAMAELEKANLLDDYYAEKRGKRISILLGRKNMSSLLGCPKSPSHNGMFLYFKENSAQTKERLGMGDKVRLVLVMTEEYQALDKAEKEDYVRRSKQLMAEYLQKKAEWRMQLGRDPRFKGRRMTSDVDLEDIVFNTDETGPPRKRKGRSNKSLGFLAFWRLERIDILDNHPDLDIEAMNKLIGKRWRALDPAEKKRFEDIGRLKWIDAATEDPTHEGKDTPAPGVGQAKSDQEIRDPA